MKTFFTTTMIVAMTLTAGFSFGQSRAKNETVIPSAVKFRAIPAQKAIVIRKDILKLNSQLVQLSDSINLAKKEIEAFVELKDNLSEMEQAESLRLQMAMDRYSKIMSTLSNLMKKMSETQQGIIQNMK